jgi:hypothetical protein
MDSRTPTDATSDDAADAEEVVEVLDGLPVLADQPRVVDAVADTAPLVPARQAAALAATGFLTGAATVAVIHRRRAKVAPRRARKAKKKGRLPFGEVVASNSFLVDVHLLRRD